MYISLPLGVSKDVWVGPKGALTDKPRHINRLMKDSFRVISANIYLILCWIRIKRHKKYLKSMMCCNTAGYELYNLYPQAAYLINWPKYCIIEF